MYGDTGVMRRRVGQLREQAGELRQVAARLVGQAEAVPWTGRAADAMRERVHARASHLHEVASRHDDAADLLARHLAEVEARKEQIVVRQRRAEELLAEPGGGAGPGFDPPPPGHRDWLVVDLPGLR